MIANTWRETLAEILPLYGHRNWIVVADSAYPSQSRAGIQTIMADVNQIAVIEHVMSELERATHVQPIVYVDAELNAMDDTDSAGIAQYHNRLKMLLSDTPVSQLPHEEIIYKLDEAAQTFNVLIIKTDMTLPYTSVFFQLECGYWNPDAEQRLRAKIASQ